MFQEQVGAISQWFAEWSEAEQMVLLYSLLKRMSPLQMRFLSRIVDQHLTDCVELQMLEQQANNPGFISSLLSKGKGVAITQLLVLLPLLRPGNIEAKARYLAIIPTILSYSVETGENLSEAKQLISYSLIHPAILSEERKQLTPWVQFLKGRFNSTPSLPANEANNWLTFDRSKPVNHLQCYNMLNQQVRVRRSNSLTPPVTFSQTTDGLWTSQDDLCAKQKPRSFSLSSEHVPPLSPQSSQASSGSGSESQLDESKSFTSEMPGMKDIGSWLKSLRLHKYIWLFAQLSYEEMMTLTEDKLEAQGVTKGARHKIILSIKKLRDRYVNLVQLEKEVIRGTNLMSALEELKTIICSPIKPANDETDTKTETEIEDIPTQFTKVVGKVCTHLIVNGGREEEAGRLAIGILERCLSHEAFIPHRRRLDTWRLQIHSLCQHTHQRQKWCQNQGQLTQGSSGLMQTDSRSLRRPFQRTSYLQQQNTTGSQIITPTAPTNLQLTFSLPNNHLVQSGLTGQNEPFVQSTGKRLLQDLTSQEPPSCVQRKVTPTRPSDPDINSRLEDLCLSMTEQFLGGIS